MGRNVKRLLMTDYRNIFHPNQFSFRRGLSTKEALFKVVSDIKKSIRCGHSAVVISFYINGALDSCTWSTMIDILKQDKINSYVINTFINYFKNKYASLWIGDSADSGILKCGVLHGSVLGPTHSGTSSRTLYYGWV